jgi:diguanylate cyclase (GGDEF)-like protein/PAS domain S-box-containing protein
MKPRQPAEIGQRVIEMAEQAVKEACMNLQPHRIMLVEDENIIAMDVQQRLEVLGYQVTGHAASGVDAIRIAAETKPDLILMDIKIRGPMDGIETAAQIRELQDVPIIYLTAFADETTVKRARLTEAFGYLLKPFEDRELQSAIEIALYKHKMEKKLRASEERYALATRAANDGIWDWDLITNEIFYTARWRGMLGLDTEDGIASPQEWFDRVAPEDRERLNATIDTHLQELTPSLECEYRILHRDGGYRWMLCRGLALFDSQSRPYRMAGSQSDITSRKLLEEQLMHRAMHDELTGLPNRVLFMDRLNVVLEKVQGHRDGGAAVMFLDLDHFKVINDSLGHSKGDALLAAFAHRLEECVRPSDTVSRFGGDEFAILASSVSSIDDVKKIADRVSQSLQKPFSLGEHEFFANASIGIVFVTNGKQPSEELLRDADIAMYHSKKNGRSRYEIFHPDMREHTLNRLQQEGEIRRALKNREFVLHYQPVFALKNRRIDGFEALIRWQHPVRGLLPPAEFMDVAELSGLIIPMGEWVLQTACKQAQAWNVATGRPLKIAVNLSPSQLADKNLVTLVQTALHESGLDPCLLELELTETAALQNIEHTIETLRALRKMGINIAVDDFGKGYSSLDYIKTLPSNNVKIDRSFIMDISGANPEPGLAIVSAMITMAHQLRLTVTAEGVETKEQLKLLTQLQCDQIQGYFTGKPTHPREIETLLKSDTKSSDAES